MSLDDGVDPYGAAWAMWDHLWSLGIYHHQNVYDTGPTTYGFDYGSHGLIWTLARYAAPVGALIGNGGHFVLVTYADTLDDPQLAFWTPVNAIAYRDPFVDPGPNNDQNRMQRTYAGWQAEFTPYGYNGTTPTAPFNCHNLRNDPNAIDGNCSDETHFGPYATNLWWGRWVTIERDGLATSNADFVFRISQ